MPKLKKGTILPNDAEELAIAQHAKEDDTELTSADFAGMKPASEFAKLRKLTRMGRPKKEHPKESTTLRLDPDILDFFKSKGKGWQTRINNVLRKHVDGARS